jgi:hypothetical protein
MRQAWHIFKKDVRQLRGEAAIYVAAVVVGCLIPNAYSLNIGESLVMLAGAYLIARLVQADALAGNRQFWITRPYRRSSLLSAKLLFILALVDLPICLVQWLILARSHFALASIWQGLGWEQFLWLACESLPMAALAALTPGPVSFACSALVAALGSVGISVVARGPAHSLHASEWVRSSIGLMVVLMASAVALYLQYRDRNTGRNAVAACAIAVAGVFAYVFVPWSLAFAVQQKFSNEGLDVAAWRVALKVSSEQWAIAMSRGRGVQLAVPLAVEGFPPDLSVTLEAAEMGLQAENGRSTEANVTDLLRTRHPAATVNCELDRDFFDAERNHPVTLRGTLFLTVFGNRRVHHIVGPRRGQPMAVTDRLRCMAMGYGVICDSPFRWPNQLIDVSEAGRSSRVPLNYGISYSPFPAELTLFPVEYRMGPPLPRGAEDALPVSRVQDLMIEVMEPVAYVRRDFEVRGVRLTDIALPWRSERVLRGGKTFFENEY